MIVIGVLGDIGSGKSFVAKQFGCPVFNADVEVSKLYRKKYYYNKLGLFRSLYHDGISGIIVQCTLIVYLFINKSYIKYI